MRQTSVVAVSPSLVFNSPGVSVRGVNTYLEITGVTHEVKRIRIVTVTNGMPVVAAPFVPVNMRSSLTKGEIFAMMGVVSNAYVTKEIENMEFVYDTPIFINGRHELRIRTEFPWGTLGTGSTGVQTVVHMICYSE